MRSFQLATTRGDTALAFALCSFVAAIKPARVNAPRTATGQPSLTPAPT